MSGVGMDNDDNNNQKVKKADGSDKTRGVKVGGSKKGKAKTDWNLNNLPPLLTVREVAEILRVSPLTIKRWGKRGKLPAIRINSRGDRRYRREAVLWALGMQSGGS
jgi:excisionase family DNA binding protein